MAKRKAVHARTARGSAPGDLSRVVSADGDHSHAALSGAAAQRRDSGNSISSAAGNSSLLLNRSLGSRSDGSLRGEKPEAYRRMPPMGSHLAAPSPPRHSFTHGEPDDSAFPLIGHAVSHASSASRDASSPMSSMLSVDSSSIIASSMSEGASATAGAASASSQDTSLEEPSRRGSTTSARRRKAQLLRKTELCAAWQVGACPISAGECDFAHGKDDLRTVPIEERTRKKLVPSTQAFRTIPCQKFTAVGWCPYGAKCTFIHDPRAVTSALLDAACVPVRRLQTTSSSKAVTQMNAAVDAVLAAQPLRNPGSGKVRAPAPLPPPAAPGSLDCVTPGQVYNPPCILDVDLARGRIVWESLRVVDVEGEGRRLTQSELNQQVEALAWYAFAAHMHDEWHGTRDRIPTSSRVGMQSLHDLRSTAKEGMVAGDPYVMPPTRSSPGVLKFAAPPLGLVEAEDSTAAAARMATSDIAETLGVASPDHTTPSRVASALAAIRPSRSRFAALFSRIYGSAAGEFD